MAAIMAGALGMLLIGLWDDKFELRPAVKFGGQFLVALVVACRRRAHHLVRAQPGSSITPSPFCGF